MNPLAWYAARALRRERERACDDAVLAAGTAGPTYAEHLLDVARAARHVTTPTWSGGVAMAHRSELEGRLMAILDDARNRQSVSYGAAGAAGVLCLALVAPLAALDPWALSAAEAQSTAVAIPPGAGPTPKAPKTPRPVVAPRAAAPVLGVVAPVALADAGRSRRTEADEAPTLAIAVEPVVATASVYAVEHVAPVAVRVAHDAAFAVHVNTNVDVDEQTLPTPSPTPTATPTPQPTPNPPNPPKGETRAQRPERVRREPVPADPRVIAALGGALKDTDVEVRQQAAHSLGQMRDPAAVDALIPALQDTDVEVRQNVVFALGQLRDVRAIPGLTIALKDSNEEVRERAAFALAQLRDHAPSIRSSSPPRTPTPMCAVRRCSPSARLTRRAARTQRLRRSRTRTPRCGAWRLTCSAGWPTTAISRLAGPIPGARARPVLFTVDAGFLASVHAGVAECLLLSCRRPAPDWCSPSGSASDPRPPRSSPTTRRSRQSAPPRPRSQRCGTTPSRR